VKTRTCENPSCGKQFEPRREHGRFCSDECRYEAWDRKHPRIQPDTRATHGPHPLKAARAEQEESKLNRSLGLLIRQAIIDACKTRGTCHADDIEGLYPVEHHSRCRKLAPAQFGSLSSLKLIEQVEYRKSVVPERKGSKSWSWRFTKAGWDKYGSVGHRAEGRGFAGGDSSPATRQPVNATPSSVSGEIVGSSDNAEGSKADCSSPTLDRSGASPFSAPQKDAASSLTASTSSPDDGSEDNATSAPPAPSEPRPTSDPEPLFGSAAYQHLQDVA
jgi:hypothetical protein